MNAPDIDALQREIAEFQARATRGLDALARLAPLPVATTPRAVVWVDGKVTLYRYATAAAGKRAAPLLIVYALVNRPTVLDLQPDRSLIRRLVELGHDVFLLDWGYPDRSDRQLGLADYVTGYLHRAVVEIAGESGTLDLLGVCQGGTLSLLYAGLEPQRVRHLVTMVTPVDFQTPDNTLAAWARGIDVDALVAAFGNVPGELLNVTFLSLMPFRLTLQKYLALADDADEPARLANFLRMEQWIFDSPDQAGRAFAEFVGWFYQQNRLVRGTVELAGRRVDLTRLTAPVLNVYASADHLVPPSASRALSVLLPGTRCEELVFDGGHIGIYVSARAQSVPAAISAWLGRAARARRTARRRGAAAPS